MTFSRSLAAVCAAVLALSLSACGAGDDEKAKESISASLMDGDQRYAATQEEADCIADGFVSEIGVDKLKDYGILNDDLTIGEGMDAPQLAEEDADAAATAVVDCVDVRDKITQGLGEVDEKTSACIDDALSDEMVHEIVAAGMAGRAPENQQDVAGAMMECMGMGDQ